MRVIAIAAGALVSACVSVSTEVRHTDTTLAAIEGARVRSCPAGREQPNAQHEGFGPASGVTGEDVAFTPLASHPNMMMRMRRLTVAPGGVIAWHDHTQVQGMAIVVAGEMVEIRNTCLDRMLHRAGDIAREDAETAHSWRNEGDEPAVVLVTHIVPR